MICPACSSPNSDSVRFCGQCGQSLGELRPEATVLLDQQVAGTAAARAPATKIGVLSPPPIDSQSITLDVSPPAAVIPGIGLREKASFGSRYRIESLLGEGGMGAVYKAYDLEVGRTVALKVLRPEIATRPEAMQRFKQELLLASKISHKNILRIHDLGDIDGIKFITMAFVEGSDLADLIEKTGRLPLERALKFSKQLCIALEAAHNEGVVHRDLKPQNILIDATDTPYVSDFGLAKSLESEITMMTRTGQILGTPRYMSPEQVEAQNVDHQSDLYSLGIIMYEMFTGQMPFRGESTMQLLYQRVNASPIDPRRVCPDLPQYLANIVLKCLEKDVTKRYNSAREILADLEGEHAPETKAPAPRARDANQTISIQLPKPSRRGVLGLAGVCAALALSFVIPGVRHLVFRSTDSSKTGAPAIQHYMAVLPFSMMGDAQNNAYLAEGVADSLSAKLSALKNVYLAPATAVASAAAKEQDPQKLAHALGVKLLFRGVVTTGANDTIQITVNLDDTANRGRSLLHQNFTGVRQDLLTLEDQIFTKLVDTLAIRQSNEELARSTQRPTEDIRAYELYLKGHNVWRGARTPQDLNNAIDLYNQAIKLDPRFPLAYAGLADSYRRLWDQKKVDDALLQKALGAAQQAQALGDNLPEVHFVLGSIYTGTGKSEQAIAELQRALELSPNSDEALRRLGHSLPESRPPGRIAGGVCQSRRRQSVFVEQSEPTGKRLFPGGPQR